MMQGKKPKASVDFFQDTGGEAFYKKQLEIANKDKARLQQRLHELETKNSILLKSLYELSTAPIGTDTSKSLPIDIIQALKKMSVSSEIPSSGFSGKGSAYRRSSPLERLSGRKSSTSGVLPHISPNYTPFRNRTNLCGHTSAVYAIQYSPNGQRLVSVSFDRSVRLWAMDRFLDKSIYDPLLSISDAHRAPVVTVEWTSDSTSLVTGGLDQSAAEWDIASGSVEPVSRFPCNGLVNTVTVSPANDQLFLVGTSKNIVYLFDRREPPASIGASPDAHTLVMNDSVVNTIHVTLDGFRVITGDHAGAIKTWDMRLIGPGREDSVGKRKAGIIDTTFNDDNHRPITHIHTSPPTSSEDYGRFMAVNSYDNYLRVYDRGSFLIKSERPTLKPLHALSGVLNTHWPIKSSFFSGADYDPPQHARRNRSRRSRNRDKKDSTVGTSPSSEVIDSTATPNLSLSDNEDDESSLSSSSSSDEEDIDEEKDIPVNHDTRIVGDSIQNMLMLASGSADGNVYIYDVGGRAGTGALLQTLEGHEDRAYAVDFHPFEPILASCSADSTVKIWHSFR